MMRRILAILLCCSGLVLWVRPVSAAWNLDLSVASSSLGLRQIGPVDESDLIYQAYGLTLHGVYLGNKSGWQLSADYLYAPRDAGGRDLLLQSQQIALKYPRRKDIGTGGTSAYYWLVIWRQDQVNEDDLLTISAQTGLIGFEVYNTAMDTGSFGAGLGLGWRELTTTGYTAAGPAASLWLNFSVGLGTHTELNFATATIWSQSQGDGYTIMEKDTVTAIGLGIRF